MTAALRLVVDVHTDFARVPGSTALIADLRSWAEIAGTVMRRMDADQDLDESALLLVTRRGEHLAEKLADELGAVVDYYDPIAGVKVEIWPQTEPVFASSTDKVHPDEPTPWATGITLTVLSAAILTTAILTLVLSVAASTWWLALVVNLVITGGLVPSAVLARRVVVWRWVAYGLWVALAASWIALAGQL